MKPVARLLNGLFTLGIALYGVLSLVGIAWVLFDRTDVSGIEFAKTIFMLTLLISPAVLILTLLARRWRLVALLLPVFGFALIYYLPFFVPKERPAPAGATVVTIMTYNLLYEDQFHDRLIADILAADPDIVALQEFSVQAEEAFTAALGELFPYHALHPQEGEYNYFRGQGIYSKFPVIETEYWQYEDLPRTHGHQRAVLDIDGTAVVIYNVHPWPPVTRTNRLWFIAVPDYDIAHSQSVRRTLERAAADQDRPVVLVGDFNMSEQFIEYRLVTESYRDAFREAGFGLGFTYNARYGLIPPLIRLDYIFYNEFWRALSAYVPSVEPSSDHLPVVATLALIGE